MDLLWGDLFSLYRSYCFPWRVHSLVEETKEQEIPEVKAEEQGSTTLIDGANEAAERMEKANAKREEILKKEEELEARKRLGGRAAGADQEQGKKEESDEDYANRALRGEIPEA